MAYEGELVKLENGRWARFQHVSLYGATPADWDGAILVAVELEERYQRMLDEAERGFEAEDTSGARRTLQLSADGQSVTVAEGTLH